jgi:hypothetical protein
MFQTMLAYLFYVPGVGMALFILIMVILPLVLLSFRSDVDREPTRIVCAWTSAILLSVSVVYIGPERFLGKERSDEIEVAKAMAERIKYNADLKHTAYDCSLKAIIERNESEMDSTKLSLPRRGTIEKYKSLMGDCEKNNAAMKKDLADTNKRVDEWFDSVLRGDEKSVTEEKYSLAMEGLVRVKELGE